jgi:DNA polymerase elongation subunit (family B)
MGVSSILVHNFSITNCDTDSISFKKVDGSEFTEQEQKDLVNEINSIMDDMIEFEHDGYFDKFIVIKAKNYVMRENNKIKYKGSSLLDSKKEPALSEFLKEILLDMLDYDGINVESIYKKYIKEASGIKDIKRWATKKSITKKVLDPSRTNEEKILDALEGKEIREGDKVYLYSAIDGEVQDRAKGELVFLKNDKPKMIPNRVLRLCENWKNDEDKEHYLKRVYMTLCIVENVVDISTFTKYHLKSNLEKVKEI